MNKSSVRLLYFGAARFRRDNVREKYLPAKLKFGRYTQFLTSCDVNYIKEVEVMTNLGNYKFDQLVRR